VRRWRGDCVGIRGLEFRAAAGACGSAPGALPEEGGIARVLPTPEPPFQACSGDGLVEDTSFSPDIGAGPGNTNGLNSGKASFLNSPEENDPDVFDSHGPGARVSARASEGSGAASRAHQASQKPVWCEEDSLI